MRSVDARPVRSIPQSLHRLDKAALVGVALLVSLLASREARAQCPPPGTGVSFGPGFTSVIGPTGTTSLDLQLVIDPGFQACGWTVTSGAAWMTVITPSSGAGDATVTVDVAANPGPSRSDYIYVSMPGWGTIVQYVIQNSCNTVLTPASASVGFAGSTGLNLHAGFDPACPATGAGSNDAWIVITDQSAVPGSANATFDVLPNTGPARVGSITMQGVAFAVTQADGCAAGTVLTPPSASVASAGATGLNVNAGFDPACPATGGVSNDAWIVITDQNAVPGSANATYDVLPNAGPARVGSITMQGVAFTVTQADGCGNASLLSPDNAAPAAGGTVGTTFQVQITPGCPWTASSNDPSWITVTAGSPGSGTGDVTYDVAPNTGPARVGTITAGGLTFTANQADGCVAGTVLTPPDANVASAGATGLNLHAGFDPACPVSGAFSNDAWIAITGQSAVPGSADATYDVLPNAGPARAGTITMQGVAFTVTQADGCATSTTLSPIGASPPAAGATGQTFDVLAAGGCAWTASSGAPWITVTGVPSGNGNGAVTYDVALNPGPARVGTITVAGQTFTVSQGDGCDASTLLVPEYLGVPEGGGQGLSFQVQTFGTCPWSAATSAPWISITSGASGTGSGTVAFEVAPNPGAARTGVITAGGRAFSVEQAEDCAATTTLQPASAAVPSAGTAGQAFSVVTGSSCYWTVAADVPWIEVLSGDSFAGSAQVVYRVAPNTGPARTGTIAAAGKTFTVSQDDGCTAAASISPSSIDLPAGRAEGLSFQVATAAGCAWTAMPDAPWIVVTAGGSGSGPGTVTYTVEANGPASRTGTILAAGRSFVVRQASDCVLPEVPRFSSYPSAPVVTGSSFTVAWAPVANLASSGFYEVRVAKNADCSAPSTQYTQEASVSVLTDAGPAATYCVQVLAHAGADCPPELVSAPSDRVVVEARPLPADFTVLQPLTPAARADRGTPPPTDSTVVFRNVGDSSGSLDLAALGGFFSISPAGTVAVPAGGDLTVRVVFDAASTSVAGVKAGQLVGSWSGADGRRSVAADVTLTVLEPSTVSTKGVRLEAVGSNRVWFRQPEGNPAPQDVAVRNTGSLPVRIAPSIGPGGSWLSVSGDFASPLPPGATRTFQLSVDRQRRASDDGAPPLSTGARIENVDGNPEDAAAFEVVDEEPTPPSAGTDRPEQEEEEFSVILGSSVSSTGTASRSRSVAHTGAEFLSDGWIRNRSADDVVVDLYYTPEGADGIEDPRVRKNTVVLGAYASYRLSDFVQGLFEATGSGHVEIRSQQLPQLSIRSSVDSLTSREGTPAQYGAELPLFVSGEGVGVATGTEVPQVGVLTGLRGPLSGSRTNVIFAETLGKPTSVRATLFDTDGRRLGEKAFTVNAYSKVQVNYDDPVLFPVPWSEGSLEYVATSGEGTVAALATVIDNASEAYVVRVAAVLERPKASASARRALAAASVTGYLPTATRQSSTAALYTTDLSVTNDSDTDVTLQVTYLPEAGLGSPAGPRPLFVPRRDPEGGPRAVVVRDVVKELTGAEANSRGMLRVEGDLSALVFSSETTTPIDPASPELGRSPSSLSPAPGVTTKFVGVFSKDSQEAVGVKLSSTDPVKQEVSHPSIEEWADFRTDLVLAELAGEPATVRVKLRKTGGATLGDPLVVSLAANERKQIDRVILAVTKPPAGVVEFRGIEVAVEAVSGKGRAVALATRVSNDPASKRADTFVLGPPVTGSASRGGKK